MDGACIQSSLTSMIGAQLTIELLLGPLGLLLVAGGIALLLAVALRPQIAWPAVIAINIFAVGPKTAGYVIIDEIATALIVGGAVLRLMLARTEPGGAIRPSRVSGGALVFVWSAYMIVQSSIGIIANEDVRLVRWVAFFALMGVLFATIFSRPDVFPFPQHRALCVTVSVASMCYFAAYILQGVMGDRDLGASGRFLTQDRFWAGSAAAVFPLLLAFPAALVLSRDRNPLLRLLAGASVALVLATGFFFDSRITFLALAALLVASFRLAGVWRAVASGAVFLAVGSLLSVGQLGRSLDSFVTELATTAAAPVNPTESDGRGRNLQNRAGFYTATKDPHTFLIGRGLYTHRELIVPAVRRLLRDYPEWNAFVTREERPDGRKVEIIRTLGIPALFVDTGIVGLLLFALLGIRSARSVRQGSPRMRGALTAVIVGAFGWLFASNIIDTTLLYIIILPGGLTQRWSEAAALDAARSTVDTPSSDGQTMVPSGGARPAPRDQLSLAHGEFTSARRRS